MARFLNFQNKMKLPTAKFVKTLCKMYFCEILHHKSLFRLKMIENQ